MKGIGFEFVVFVVFFHIQAWCMIFCALLLAHCTRPVGSMASSLVFLLGISTWYLKPYGQLQVAFTSCESVRLSWDVPQIFWECLQPASISEVLSGERTWWQCWQLSQWCWSGTPASFPLSLLGCHQSGFAVILVQVDTGVQLAAIFKLILAQSLANWMVSGTVLSPWTFHKVLDATFISFSHVIMH